MSHDMDYLVNRHIDIKNYAFVLLKAVFICLATSKAVD